MAAPAASRAQAAPPEPTATSRAPAASLRVRAMAMLYEALLMFGVLFLASYLYGALTQQRHALQGRLGLQAFVFVVTGIYFVWFWSHGRQTVAQKTWRIALQTTDGAPLSQPRALARYVAAWLWFAPALAWLAVAGRPGPAAITASLAVGAVAYGLLALVDPDRQFLHDRLCRTRLVRLTPPA